MTFNVYSNLSTIPSSSEQLSIVVNENVEPGPILIQPSNHPPLPYESSASGYDISAYTQERSQISESLDSIAVREKKSRVLKGKEKEWTSVVEKKRPLRLLDLPVDVLKEIIKEVTHTNDLTSLALTHSALHNLAIPYIYSRFDIVWPDAHNTAEPRTGVDALTYGLGTLVMGEEVFGNTSTSNTVGLHRDYTCNHCGSVNSSNNAPVGSSNRLQRRRRGNYFSQFTRKFSLGNGPSEWVQEYLIAKEGGKMLGTLVALAVARMPNLETFVWDMPTGVLRDVWLALSSLGDSWNGQESRLEKLWIRWHNNRDVALGSGTQQPTAVPLPPPASLGPATNSPSQPGYIGNENSSNASQGPTILELSYRHVEYPSFSILPPLKSLTVLDIDEPAYLEEMSVLIERSLDRMRELRIGVSSSVSGTSFWSSTVPNDTFPPSSHDSSIGFLESGGVLGMIMSKIYDCRIQKCPLSVVVRETHTDAKPISSNNDIHVSPNQVYESTVTSSNAIAPNHHPLSSIADVALSHLLKPGSLDTLEPDLNDRGLRSSSPTATNANRNDLLSYAPIPASTVRDPRENSDVLASSIYSLPLEHADLDSTMVDHQYSQLAGSGRRGGDSEISMTHQAAPAIPIPPKPRKLRLAVLEMERVSMNVLVLQKTIDWSIITSLTLLHCGSHEQLWKALRRMYSPRSSSILLPQSSQPVHKRNLQPRLRHASSQDTQPFSSSDYRLNLKKIHTNTVSPALISFLKETLAPNSLQWMFLQEGGSYASSVTIDTIYRGPLRRHRGSLKKVMIDSTDGISDSRARNQKWRKWMFNREVLSFVTSGKMSTLKELGMAVDYKDWHLFLQRLPQIPQLRSLYVSHIADHVYAHHLDPKELALQVMDIVALRPDIELCYMGISNKCFEILENKNSDDSVSAFHDSTTSAANAGPGGVATGGADEDSEADDDDDDEDEDVDDNVTDEAAAAAPLVDPEDTESDAGEDSLGDSEDDAFQLEDGRKKPRLKLREILFYDDKVSIFKARHGRL